MGSYNSRNNSNMLTEQEIIRLLDYGKKYYSIVANGEFPSSMEVINILKNSDIIIACDGAGSKLNDINITPDYIVGDSDSDELKQAIAKNPYIYIEDQNCNDLTKAVQFLRSMIKSQIPVLIFAANGLREDHAIANIALLYQYSEYFDKVLMISDYGIFETYKPWYKSINTICGQQISLFSIDKANKITCEELKWPLKSFTLQYLNSGTLNQAISRQISIKCDKPTLLYRSFEIKKS